MKHKRNYLELLIEGIVEQNNIVLSDYFPIEKKEEAKELVKEYSKQYEMLTGEPCKFIKLFNYNI